MIEILKQGQYVPMSVERQILIIYAGTHGYLDKYPVEKLGIMKQQLSAFIEKKHPEIYAEIVKSGKIDDVRAQVEAALEGV